jgi:hypothetical protein
LKTIILILVLISLSGFSQKRKINFALGTTMVYSFKPKQITPQYTRIDIAPVIGVKIGSFINTVTYMPTNRNITVQSLLIFKK